MTLRQRLTVPSCIISLFALSFCCHKFRSNVKEHKVSSVTHTTCFPCSTYSKQYVRLTNPITEFGNKNNYRSM
jgi:hypothetical protein